MGKNLIIKGADFSKNSIGKESFYELITDTYSRVQSLGFNVANITSAGWTWKETITDTMAGRTIDKIGLYVKTAGTFSIGKIKKTEILSGTPSYIAEIDLKGEGYSEYNITGLTLLEDEVLVIGKTTDTGKMGYVNATPNDGFYRKVGQSGLCDFFAESTIPIKVYSLKVVLE